MRLKILFPLLLLLVYVKEAAALPPEIQEERAHVIAWCDVTSIQLNEKPRIEFGTSSQLRTFSFKISEVVKGEMPDDTDFSIRFAQYEILNPRELKHIVQPEIMVREIHRRPKIEIGRQYKVYLYVNPDGIAPIKGRWSILESREDPKLFEKLTGKPEPKQ